MFHCYIIHSASLGKYYVGSCEDLEKRLHDHAVGHSNYTKAGKPWDLKWSKEFSTRAEAVQAESRIKAMKSKKYIEQLIHANG